MSDEKKRSWFVRLVRVCRKHISRACDDNVAGDAGEACDLLEALYAVCAEQEVIFP